MDPEGRKKANELISQIKSSCDMVVVGKAVWKMMAIPSILFGRAVIPTRETNIKSSREQKIEFGGTYWEQEDIPLYRHLEEKQEHV